MKNYTYDDKDENTFILNYKIEKGMIIAKLANGEKYTIPYSKENEEIILKKMERQVKYAAEKELADNAIKKLILFFSFLVCSLGVFIIGKNIVWAVISILDAAVVCYGAAICIPAKLKERELKKLKYFLEHKEEFEEMAEELKKNDNITHGLRPAAIRQIAATPEDKPFLDINIIDKFSLNDLMKMKSNMEREELFGFNRSEEEIEKEEARVKALTPPTP